MSVFTDIADDLVTAIKAGTYAIEQIEPFQGRVKRVQVVEYKLVELDKLHVAVAPFAIEKLPLNRSATLKVFVFQVAVIKRIKASDNKHFDDYMGFVDELGDTLEFLDSTTQPSASWMTPLTLPATYSPEELRNNNVFFAVLETRYRM